MLHRPMTVKCKFLLSTNVYVFKGWAPFTMSTVFSKGSLFLNYSLMFSKGWAPTYEISIQLMDGPDLKLQYKKDLLPECVYNPITAMGFSAMFTFQLDNTKR